LNSIYIEISQRIHGECQDLERVVQRALRAWPYAQKSVSEQEVYLDSVALNLHSFYSGLERLFELIARHIDHSIPDGEAWHRDLLQQMAKEIKDIRPAVIGQNNAKSLDEFRRFRHLVRNVYATNLVPDRISKLMSKLPDLWKSLHAELLAFADFIDELAKLIDDK
jgi:HepT-like protein